MLEKELEAYLVKRVKELGGRSYKWVSPGNVGVPDRIVLLKVAPEHAEIVSRYVKFVELKQPGKRPTAVQRVVMAQLRALDFRATWTDSKEGVDEILA